jgi:hypothetical protein
MLLHIGMWRVSRTWVCHQGYVWEKNMGIWMFYLGLVDLWGGMRTIEKWFFNAKL